MALQEHDPMAEKRSAAREILEDARFEEDQAEAIIATVNFATENLATKEDVEELRGEMKEGFKLLDERMNLSDERTDNKFEKMSNQLGAYTISTDAKFDNMLDKIDNRFDKINNWFDKINNKIDANASSADAKFDKLDNKIDANANSANARFDQIDVRFDKLEARFKNQTLQIIVGVSSTLIAAVALYTALTKLL